MLLALAEELCEIDQQLGGEPVDGLRRATEKDAIELVTVPIFDQGTLCFCPRVRPVVHIARLEEGPERETFGRPTLVGKCVALRAGLGAWSALRRPLGSLLGGARR